MKWMRQQRVHCVLPNRHRGLGWSLLFLSLVGMLGSACNRNHALRKQKFMERGDRYFGEKKYGEAVIEYRNAVRVDPTFGEGFYRLGLALLQEGQWSRAGECFSRAVKLSPDNIDAHLRLSGILIAAGQFDEGRAEAEEVLKIDPQNANVHLLLGQIQLQRKKYTEAEGEFGLAIELAPKDPVPYGNLGIAQLLSGNFDKAEKDFQKAAELSPQDPQYVINWANFYRSRQQPQRGEQVLRQSMEINRDAIELPLALADLYVAEGRSEDAQRVLDQTEANSNQYPEGPRKIADFYYLHGDASSALERYLVLARKGSSDKSLIDSMVQCYLQLRRWSDAEGWIDKEDKKGEEPAFQLLRARVHMGEYRLRDAVTELQSLIQNEPGNILALYYLAQADMQRGDLEASKSALADALRVQPGFASALLGLGDIELQQQDPEKALEFANQVIARSYWVADAHLLSGNAYILRNNASAALKEFQIAVGLAPRRSAPLERVGRVLSAEGKYADAEKPYENALQADPGYALALGGLAENLLAQGQPDRARARIELQIERKPLESKLRVIKGEFCLDLRDWECSEQSFQRAIELDPYDATTYVSLGRVYAVQNRPDDALKEYELARQRFPEYLPIYVELAHVYQERSEFDRAKRTYQDALQINSRYVRALNGLAWLDCEHGGPLNEALELAQQAKKQQPNDPHINDTLGWIYFKKGLYPSAVELLKAAVEESPKETVYQFHLGMVYLALGKQDQGRRTLQAALRAGLNAEDARAAKEALQGGQLTGPRKERQPG
jgi:tetratricopeptide (TPR) repeat protein